MKQISFRTKVMVSLIAFAVLLTTIICISVGLYYRETSMEQYNDIAFGYAKAAAQYIDGDIIERYDTTEETDDYYYQVLDFLNSMQANQVGLRYYYVQTLHSSYVSYIWDANASEEGNPLGFQEEFTPEDANLINNFKNDTFSEELFVYKDSVYGYVGCAFWPIKNSAGENVAVVGVDLSMESINTNLANFQRMIMIIITVLVLLLITILFVFFDRTLIKPIQELTMDVSRMAAGDFNVDIRHTSKDEIGQLADAMRILCGSTRAVIADLSYILDELGKGNLLVSSQDDSMYVGDYSSLLQSVGHFIQLLNETLFDIRDSADLVLNNTGHLSDESQNLSHDASEQASSIKELAVTIQEVTEKINENARSADDAVQKTGEAGNEMNVMNARTKDLVAAMNEITDFSNQIVAVAKAIEDISFQTNILSLNASIEASRAGIAGKGFAVVASEVRSLAAKSSEAAKDTHALIDNTIAAVQKGHKLVEEVAKRIAAVTEASGQVVRLNTGIAESSSGIARSVSQVNTGIEQISRVVQTTAATAQQAASSSQELSGQARFLQNQVGKFTLLQRDKQRQKSSASKRNTPSEF